MVISKVPLLERLVVQAFPPALEGCGSLRLFVVDIVSAGQGFRFLFLCVDSKFGLLHCV